MTPLRTLLRRMKHQPLRSLLTLLQILLGSAVLTLTLSMYVSSQRPEGEDLFFITSGELMENSSTFLWLFLEQDFPELLGLAPDVESISVYEANAFDATASYEGQRYEFLSTAVVSPSYFEITELTPSRGHFFGKAEHEAREPSVLVSDEAAQMVFGETDPVGQELKFGGSSYRVAGTFTNQPSSAELFNQPPTIFMPPWTYIAGGSYSRLIVKAKPGQGEAAKAQLLAAVRSVYRGTVEAQGDEVENFFYTSSLEQGDWGFTVLNPLFIVLAMFSAGAVIVVAISLFSATVTDIMTRHRELAIKRAIGASSNRVSVEMTLESTFRALIGSVLGVLLVGLLVPVLRDTFRVSSTSFTWEPVVALGVILGVVLLGVGSSFVPAVQASQGSISQNLGEG
jgi:putative ABC transport system permease protein